MPKEDQAQYRHEIFVLCEVGIGPQAVRDVPEVRLELFNALKVVCCHALFPYVFPVSRGGSLAPMAELAQFRQPNRSLNKILRPRDRSPEVRVVFDGETLR